MNSFSSFVADIEVLERHGTLYSKILDDAESDGLGTTFEDHCTSIGKGLSLELEFKNMHPAILMSRV